MGNCCQLHFSEKTLQRRYCLSSKRQAQALKSYLDIMRIPIQYVDTIYKIAFEAQIDGGDFVNKREFLNLMDMKSTPFSMSALNTLDGGSKAEFFELFCAVHYFCCFNRQQLISHTFNLVDPYGKGRLHLTELALLVHHVYGEYVAKAEDGELIRTHNRTNIESAQLVMNHMDPSGKGSITLKEFAQGLRVHANLLQPIFQTQRLFRSALGGTSFWEREEMRLHLRCTKLKLNLLDKFHDCLRLVKDPTKNRSSFTNYGVAGQGGLSEIGSYDVSGNLRGPDGSSTEQTVNTFKHKSGMTPRGSSADREGSKTPRGSSIDRTHSPRREGGKTPRGSSMDRTHSPRREGSKTPRGSSMDRTHSPRREGGKTPRGSSIDRTHSPRREGGKTPRGSSIDRTYSPRREGGKTLKLEPSHTPRRKSLDGYNSKTGSTTEHTPRGTVIKHFDGYVGTPRGSTPERKTPRRMSIDRTKVHPAP